ncbi:MAG: EamA/RhaT family transporter, partial [Thermoproteota archaeon]
MVPFFSKAIAGEQVTLYSKVGALLAFLGLLLLTSPGGGLNIGDLLTLASAVSFALQVVYVSKYTRRLDSITLTSAEIAT